MALPSELVLGTHNAKKGRELFDLLRPHGLRLRTLAEFPDALDVVEDGKSFAENAKLKAGHQAQHLGHWVIGEDSGLVVDALDGAPGIYSARYSGQNADDQSNNQRLLDELAEAPIEQRTAHYVCHVTLADPSGTVQIECEASCRGRIRLQPAGGAGFGYDPLFEIIEYHRTFGELGEAVKSQISHRARALRMFTRQLLSVR